MKTYKVCSRDNCNKEFIPKPGKKFCSIDCRKIHNSKGLYERECRFCGKGFITNKPNKKHCSYECQQGYARKVRHERLVENYEEKVCVNPECNTKFRGPSIQKYCSKKCAKFNHNELTKKKEPREKGCCIS